MPEGLRGSKVPLGTALLSACTSFIMLIESSPTLAMRSSGSGLAPLICMIVSCTCLTDALAAPLPSSREGVLTAAEDAA